MVYVRNSLCNYNPFGKLIHRQSGTSILNYLVLQLLAFVNSNCNVILTKSISKLVKSHQIEVEVLIGLRYQASLTLAAISNTLPW